MNRIATVYLLRKALNPVEAGVTPLEDAAMFTLHALRHYPDQNALLTEVRRNGDAKRVETIVAAKIFAELIAALEDLGALADAIRHRGRDGVFSRYLNSKTNQAADFFNYVLGQDIPEHPEIALDILLNLPSIQSLDGKVTGDALQAFAQSYGIHAQQLHQAAHMYREQGAKVAPLGAGSPPLPTWHDDVNILLGIIKPGVPAASGAAPAAAAAPVPATAGPHSKSGILVRAFNKLKHRFMVTEDLPAYAVPAGADKIEYGRFPQTPQFIDQLVSNTVAVAGTMAELAAIVLQLDAAGIPI